MLILQKAYLFDVRFGYKMNAIKKVFDEERNAYSAELAIAEQYSSQQIDAILIAAKEESMNIYSQLQEIDPKKQSVRGQLNSMNQLFDMNIDYEKEWLKFIGIDIVPISI
jgi:hypothetical protein